MQNGNPPSQEQASTTNWQWYLEVLSIPLGWLAAPFSTPQAPRYGEESDAPYEGIELKCFAEQFKHLIAVEGEDNQNRAEALLTQLMESGKSDLVFSLLVEKRQIKDAPGHEFENLSAYGYAFWAGDTRMCRMLEKFMDDETKAKALEECQSIATEGVTFTFLGETIEHSTHFDFQPLINAYNAYIASARLLIDARDWTDDSWKETDKLWLGIGKAQAKVPTHVAQEYCLEVTFDPLKPYILSLHSHNVVRSSKFYDRFCKGGTRPAYPFYTSSGANPDIGEKITILKNSSYRFGFGARANDLGMPGWFTMKRCGSLSQQS